MKPFTIILLIFCTGLTACYKNRPKPNEPFFCKVNGETFRPDDNDRPIGGIGSNPLRATFSKKDGILFISARNSPKIVSLLIIMPNKVLTIGNFELRSDSLSSKGSFTPSNSVVPVEDLLSTSGSLQIDKIDGFKISGKFEFKTPQSRRNGIIYEVTDGQFNDLSTF